MAEAKPEGMSDQDWSNFQSRYRSNPDQMAAQRAAAGGQNPAGTPTTGAGLTPSPGSQAGVPGAVDPALKNPAPAPTPALQPSPAPQVGLGNTLNTGGGLQRTQDTSVTYDQYGQPKYGTATNGQPPNPQAQMQDALRAQIMGMLGTNVNAASVTDADIAPQSQAFAAAQERYGAARRAELAQQASRGGWSDSGGFDQRLDALSQQTAQAVGANDAALVGQKLESRRQQLTTAMQAAQQMGMADEANNLQRQLANLDAQIKTRGQDIDTRGQDLQTNLANLDASTRIYLGDLNAKMQQAGLSSQERLAALDNELKKYGIDVQGRLGELDAALRSQLGNRQIDLGYDTLGLDAATTQARLNREAMMAAMGQGG